MKYLLTLILLTFTFSIAAQDSTPVEIPTEDGLTIIGDFYAPTDLTDETAPAVLLLHMLSSNRSAWRPLIPELVDAGYYVLAVDMRGHGDTGGSNDWELAVTDVQVMLDWLKAQDSVGEIATIGGSIGSNLALIGCGNDEDCVTAIALSPGLDYRGVQPQESIVTDLAQRSALLIGSHDDDPSGGDIPQLVADASGEVGMWLFPGRLHGTNLLNVPFGERVIGMIVTWLDTHME